MQDEPGTADAPVRVLRGRRGKWVWVFIGAAVFVAFGFLPGYQDEHPVVAWLGIVFFGACALMALALLLFPAARGTLTLDSQGFVVKTFGRGGRTNWKDVAGFGMVRISGARFIGLVYHSGYQPMRAAREMASGLTGVEGAIQDNYEVRGEELVALLEEWHARFG